MSSGLDTALLHGLFPEPVLRRTLLRSVGAGTLLGALSSILPIDALKAIAQERKPLEKTRLNVGFLPITCATPLIYGEQLGSYAKEGLQVSLQKIAGINLIRDKMINGELDVSQQVMPVALTMTAGLGGTTQSIKVLTILNQNGNSLVLANKHKDNRDPKKWKGFVFAVPFEQSHQAMQLRNYLAAAGLDPDKDATYRIVPPTEYVSSLRVGSIDGFFGGEPGGQRAVYEGAGFIHLDLEGNLERASLLLGHGRRILDQAAPEHVHGILSCHHRRQPARLGQEQSSGHGQGAGAAAVPQCPGNSGRAGHHGALRRRTRQHQERSEAAIDYQPFPHYSAAVWLMTQLRRWNMLKEDVDYKKLAQQVMLATDAEKIMRDLGATPPAASFGKEMILGKEFDSSKPEEYLKSVRKPA